MWLNTSTPSRRTGHQDHYYWLTAFLAARGLQRKTCLLIAVTTFVLGLIPVVLTFGGEVSQVPWWMAAGITLCCTVIAALWARPQWPSRALSQISALAGSGCIAVFCLLQIDPMVGLLGTLAFLTQTVFISFFHSVRWLALTWTIAVATLVILAVRLSALDASLAFSAVALVGFVNVFTAFGCVMVIRLIDHQVRHGDIEPLTGLLTREAFEEKVATLIGARSRDDDRFLVVAVLALDGYSLLLSLQGVVGARRARIAVSRQMRDTARADATIAHVGESEFLLADLFTTLDPHPMIERFRSAICAAPSRLTASIGVVSTPVRPLAERGAPDVIEELLTLASAAMYDARKSGGNQAQYVLNPDLAVLSERNDEWPHAN